MSLDAIVWLVVGMGIGMGASLVLLVAYASLEHRRLGRRLRQARAEAAGRHSEPLPPRRFETPGLSERQPALVEMPAATPPVAPPLGTGHSSQATSPVEVAVTEDVPPDAAPAEPPPAGDVAEPTPATPAAASAPLASAQPVPTASVISSEMAEVVDVEPAAAAAPAAPPPIARQPGSVPMSVEELFAEAFALDRVAIAPLADKEDGTRS